ncbi:UDP-N-acetylglucosamine 1-carboxyvinyltransferase [Aliidongia dinghuensis]|uniref:UDP-N-acetylglucosamine 1-carboxyvinyltransferase n=1 Tax=Aliidongia dinghuensis TaxID=1867774 RepID=A0A8J3E5D6_9PROT|nr:UDP-N-acetylglucosamine 1-carboxyvinyltransferase [Aliidongia dinghuensis]GGF46523.1 UDP-N-acetylglucosamine 1-carboxyvinyltransferase [Aliidongia dinghuensis]
MDKIRIRGGVALHGVIPIGGSKNAALPLMAASLLSAEPLVLCNLPHLADVTSMANLLNQHGVEMSLAEDLGRGANGGHCLRLDASRITSTEAPYDLVRKMRASVLVLGPLLARCGEARVSLPGGCAIGARPVDLHIKGLQQLGAEIEIEQGYIHATAPRGLKGAEVVLPIPSVGATENLLMAASLAEGETVLVNVAREPEIVDLAQCLVAMGAEVAGAGTDRITIKGRERLNGATHRVIADRIETGTYMMAAAITGGEVLLTGTSLKLLAAVGQVLGAAGIEVSEVENGIRVKGANGDGRPVIQGVDVMTEPFPGFPTDLQAQMMALMCIADGAAMITETIFENRFMHVPELCRMGANINIHGASAMVRGVKRLTGAPVMATDLRASVSLVLAGLAAEGETIVNRVYHLDRGYERLESKLAACGAQIERIRTS